VDIADGIGSAVSTAAIVRPAARRAVGETGRGRAEERDDHDAQQDGDPHRSRASAGSWSEDARTGMHETLVANIGSPGCET
jgi:hypothetical protein